MSIDPMEFGRVLQRLDAQDIQTKEMREDIRMLLELANRGKGSIAMLVSIGMVVSTVIGWFSGKWFK